MITLDGSHGEGGGQILRSALALSMCTGQPFRLERIRAKRSKPGLLRQHLTAVQAAQALCGATVAGARLNSQTLDFLPGTLKAGEYRFDIGSAGSCTLVLQTLIPALLKAGGASRVTVTGGTHNMAAPPADFLRHAFLPQLDKMGVIATLTTRKYGFYPAGGGELVLDIEPAPRLQPLHLLERGPAQPGYAESWLSSLPGHVAERELMIVREKLGWGEEQCHVRSASALGPGNVLMVFLPYAQVTEVFTAFGAQGVSAESVGKQACGPALRYLHGTAAIGEHLADQLLLPLALAGGGSFTTCAVSSHCTTNMAVIERLLPVCFSQEALGPGLIRISVGPR